MLTALLVAAALAADAAVDVDLDPRKRLSPDDLARKNEHSYVTGLPLAAYDPSFGLGGGARVYFYENGSREHPLFPYTPYLRRMFAQIFASSRGLQFHWLDFDAPYFRGTPYRLRTQLIYERNLAKGYYGTGPRSLAALTSPADGRRYETMGEYRKSIERIDGAGMTYSRYDMVDLERPALFLYLERTFMSGTVRPLFGLTFSHASVDDFTGERVSGADGRKAIMGTTRLARDCDLGRVRGCDGGFDNMLRLGLSFDTRDFEPDPNSGLFTDLALDAATGLLGSDYDYLRALASARLYWSPAPKLADLVLALRGAFEWQSADTPFFSMNLLAFTDDSRAGLGGVRTMRGFSQDRFIGNVMALLNAEARYTFGHVELLEQKLAFIVAAFLDSGRTWDELDQVSWRRWQLGGGGALRIAWNQATVVMFDYGKSAEDAGLYVNFNHIF